MLYWLIFQHSIYSTDNCAVSRMETAEKKGWMAWPFVAGGLLAKSMGNQRGRQSNRYRVPDTGAPSGSQEVWHTKANPSTRQFANKAAEDEGEVKCATMRYNLDLYALSDLFVLDVWAMETSVWLAFVCLLVPQKSIICVPASGVLIYTSEQLLLLKLSHDWDLNVQMYTAAATWSCLPKLRAFVLALMRITWNFIMLRNK